MSINENQFYWFWIEKKYDCFKETKGINYIEKEWNVQKIFILSSKLKAENSTWQQSDLKWVWKFIKSIILPSWFSLLLLENPLHA